MVYFPLRFSPKVDVLTVSGGTTSSLGITKSFNTAKANRLEDSI